MKNYYLYSEGSKEFRGVFMAQADPYNAGEYLKPSNSTDKEPALSKNKMPIFNTETGNWDYLPDYSQEQFYSTETGELIILQVGQEIPTNSTKFAPPEGVLSKWNGSEWLSIPNDGKNYEWTDNNWTEIIPIAMGTDLISFLESAVVVNEELKTQEEKQRYFDERVGLQKFFQDLAWKATFLSPVCNPLPFWFLEIALKTLEQSKLIEPTYKALFMGLISSWVAKVKFIK